MKNELSLKKQKIVSLKMFYYIASFNLDKEKLGKSLHCARDVFLWLKLIGQILVRDL